jgi:hypothetical protein
MQELSYIEHQIRVLDNEHRQLANKLEALVKRPGYTDEEVEILKKKKLLIKDKLARLYKEQYERQQTVNFDRD